MIDLEVSIAGASRVGQTGAVLWQPNSPLTDSTSDVVSHGESQVFQSLGLSSMPWPKDESGYAEALIATGVPGLNAIVLGGRDTRSAAIVGRMKPGDTVLHSTGPNQAAQIQLKEEKRQAAILTEDVEGYTQLILLDGKAQKLQIVANGAAIEIDKSGGISIIDASGAGIIVKDGKTHITGDLIVGNGQNPLKLMVGPPTGSPGGPASVPLMAVKGISVSAAFMLAWHLVKFLVA